MICAFGVFTLFGALTAVCELGFLQEICSTITSPNKLDLMMVVLSAILIFLGVWALEQVQMEPFLLRVQIKVKHTSKHLGKAASSLLQKINLTDSMKNPTKTKRDVFVAGRWRYGGIWEELAQEQALVGSKLNCQVCATSKYVQISSIDLHKYFKYLTKKDI